MTSNFRRRRTAALGITTLVAALTGRVRAQTPPAPTPENLARELPSPRAAPKAGANLPDMPPPQPAGLSELLFPGFRSQEFKTSSATIHTLSRGTGQPLLLIHGHPETHVTWHKVASALVDAGYQIILPGLRGYGDSSKPGYSPQSSKYSFRAMAQEMVDVMRQLGHSSFMVAGHDRGGRVVHRLCLDHPDAAQKAAVLDVAPTRTMYDDTHKEFATRYVWWFLQIRPAPMPEHLISLDPSFYLRDHLALQGKTAGAVTPEAMAEYIRTHCCQSTIRTVCEDYRGCGGHRSRPGPG